MKNAIAFNIPLDSVAGKGFIECFAPTYMFLEGIGNGEVKKCQKGPDGKCVRCGNCGSPDVQAEYFYMFSAMSGQSTTRERFDGELSGSQKWLSGTRALECGTDDMVEFLFGFAGYEYRKHTDCAKFRDEIITSIDAGRPVIARGKEGDKRFHVIVGYKDNKLLYPRNQSPQGPQFDRLDTLYIIGGKTEPRFSPVDGLRRIQRVLEMNGEEKLWDGYIETMVRLSDGGDKVTKAEVTEKTARMKRVADTMGYTWQMHSFAEALRKCLEKEPQSPALSDCLKNVDSLVGDIMGYTWGLVHLKGRMDWSDIHFAAEDGILKIIRLSLQALKETDDKLLETIKEAIAILEEAAS